MDAWGGRRIVTESIELFIEGHGLSSGRMIWLLAHPLPPSPISKLDRRHTGRLRKRDNVLTGGWGEGEGEEQNQYDRKKAWSSITIKYFLEGQFNSSKSGGNKRVTERRWPGMN